MRYSRICAMAALWLLPFTRADVRNCLCDVDVPATMEARECSLCREAEKQPADIPCFFLRDVNPNKPHRWLALPRFHGNRPQQFQDMTPAQRTEFWTAAIARLTNSGARSGASRSTPRRGAPNATSTSTSASSCPAVENENFVRRRTRLPKTSRFPAMATACGSIPSAAACTRTSANPPAN